MLRANTRFASLTLVAALGASCGSPGPAPGDGAPQDASDVATDVQVPRCDMVFHTDTGDANGHPQPLGASATEARAGRIRAEDLPTDRTGLAVYSPGDFVLANDRVAVLIEDVGPSQLYDPWGGKFVGVARVQGGRLVDAADFNELLLGVGRFILDPTSVSVLRDGSAGGAAVVRAEGRLRPIPFIESIARPLAPMDYSDLHVAVDYELAPGSDSVDVFVTFDNTRAVPVDVRLSVHGSFQRYRMPSFVPAGGFAEVTADVPWIGFIDDTAASYAWMSTDSALSPLLSTSGFDAFTSAAYRLPACAQTRRPMGRMTIGGPGVDGLVQAVARREGTRLRTITGTVTDGAGAPAAGVRVHALVAGTTTYLTRAATDAAGAYTLHVPESADVELYTWRRGDAVVGPRRVSASEGTAALALTRVGAVHVTATEAGSNAPLPARVQLIPMGAMAPTLADRFGEEMPAAGRLHIAFPTDGNATLAAPPGSYRVVVSHGYEYEILDRTVTVAAGETVEVPASLRRSVATPGVLCGDFHIHTFRSPDSVDDARYKLTSAVADGVELPVRSDHEFVADFEPLIQSLGLGAWARGVPSLELTTFTWGHMGVVPLEPDPSLPNAGAVDWIDRTPPQVFAAARARPTQPTVIINHPRSTSFNQGYFAAAGWDPAANSARRPEWWDTEFTAVEFFNDSDFERNRDTGVRDWFGMLNHGRRVFTTGSSDSHSINSPSPVGYPRTCMYLGTDDPRAATNVAVRDAVAHGRSYVSGGVYIEASASGGVGPGQDARGAGAMAQVQVSVQAATWIHANRLEVIVDGTSTESITLDAGTADPANPVVRLRRAINVPVAAAGSWVVFVVHGDELLPVHPGRNAFGVTNPIFLAR